MHHGWEQHDSTSTLDVVTTVASSAAVMVALVAVGVGWSIARRERSHARLIERQGALIELLAAFEAMQAYRAPMFVEGSDNELTTAAETLPHEFENVRARWRANLYASAEALPYTRQAAFSHFGAGPIPEGTRLEGNPEVDTPEMQAVRGEIVDALDRLRKQLQG